MPLYKSVSIQSGRVAVILDETVGISEMAGMPDVVDVLKVAGLPEVAVMLEVVGILEAATRARCSCL